MEDRLFATIVDVEVGLLILANDAKMLTWYIQEGKLKRASFVMVVIELVLKKLEHQIDLPLLDENL